MRGSQNFIRSSKIKKYSSNIGKNGVLKKSVSKSKGNSVENIYKSMAVKIDENTPLS